LKNKSQETGGRGGVEGEEKEKGEKGGRTCFFVAVPSRRGGGGGVNF